MQMVATVMAAISVASAASGFQSSFAFGLIRGSCAPWDGPAIDLRLTTEPAECKRASEPYIDIGMWRGLPIHAGQEVKFGAGSDAGFASLCAKVDDCQRAESGWIQFETFEQGTGSRGHYELHFKGVETMKGSFDAKWCQERVICR
jgi:hypothetical protein